MSGNITATNGGTIILKLLLIISNTETYLLDMSFTRTTINAIENIELKSTINLPKLVSSELSYMNIKINAIEITDLTGKLF